MMGSWKGRRNQYIQLVKVLYCKLLAHGKQLPGLTLEAVPGTEPRPQRWEARVLPLCHCGPFGTSTRVLELVFVQMTSNILLSVDRLGETLSRSVHIRSQISDLGWFCEHIWSWLVGVFHGVFWQMSIDRKSIFNFSIGNRFLNEKHSFPQHPLQYKTLWFS